MAEKTPVLTKRTLDKDLDKYSHVEDASKFVARKLIAPGIGLVFLGLAMLFAGVYVFDRPGAVLVIAAAAFAAYMAMNIGANDVTNNVGAAVGAPFRVDAPGPISGSFKRAAGSLRQLVAGD